MIAQIQLRNIVILIALVDIRPARCDNFFKTVNLFTVLCTVVKFLSKQNGRGLEYRDQYILFFIFTSQSCNKVPYHSKVSRLNLIFEGQYFW